MSISVTVQGVANFKKVMASLPKNVQDEVNDLIDDTALDIHADILESIYTGNKSGRLYRRGVGRFHRASAPGQAPANDRGHLGSSIIIASRKADDPSQPAIIIAKASYARPLEEGTSRMKARPFMRPPFKKHVPRMNKKLKTAIERGLRKSSRESRTKAKK